MFAPTKIWRHWHRRINKNQRRYAVAAALAAAALPSLVEARGHRISELPQVPLVVDNAVESLKTTKAARKLLESLGAYEDVQRSEDSRKIRAGHGKWRNRRYVQRRGPLVVYEKNDGVVQAFRNMPGVDLCSVDALNLLQLAPGGHVGRFVVFSQGAFTKLEALFGSGAAGADPNLKKRRNADYVLPRAKMANADLSRLINSDEVQSVVRATKAGGKRRTVKHNPLKNLDALVKLNPYAKVWKRKEYLKAEKRRAERAAKAAAKRK
jgi:large subunit ribosomal protein L4e